MKQCSYCATVVENNIEICPKCKRKIGYGVVGITLIIIAAIWCTLFYMTLFFLFGSGKMSPISFLKNPIHEIIRAGNMSPDYTETYDESSQTIYNKLILDQYLLSNEIVID